MKNSEFVYIYKGNTYCVHVEKHHQRNTYFRYRSDGFHVSASYFTSQAEIVRFLDKCAEKLIKKYNQRNSNFSFEEDYFYVLGEKCSLSSLGIKDESELNKLLKTYAKEQITELVRAQEKIMNIEVPYQVSIRKTVAQFGSNSLNTHTLSFQLGLIHYSKEIINSVVVHELAHEFHRNHQKQFYNVVYKYCPDYKLLQTKLKKGIHQ